MCAFFEVIYGEKWKNIMGKILGEKPPENQKSHP